MTYRFLSPAKAELAEATEYYENAVPGLGLEFLDEIETTIARIVRQPQAWTQVSENHRRCLTRRFPYGIVYSVEHDEILIAAVMNLRRHPDSWKSRE